ncbi:MAG: RNA polymerase sigma factor [Bacteroidia bacterium]
MTKRRSISDEELVRLLLETGNTIHFEKIYQRYFNKVYYQVLSYLKDAEESQDLAQDIFVKLFDRISKFQGKSTFSTWLFSLTRNACLDYLRKQGRVKEQALDDKQAEEIAEIEDSELLSIKSERLAVILEQIHPDEKSLLIMMYAYEWQMDEIAAHLGIKLGAIKMRLKRTKAKVKQLYDEQYQSD